MQHIGEKVLTRATTLLDNSFQLDEKDIMALQNAMSPDFKNIAAPNLGVLGQNDIWMEFPWLITKNTIRGRWWLPSSPGCGESWESVYVRA
jgi:hypothetical protein